MTSNFNRIEPEAIQENIVKLIGSDWMLITAGNKKNFNAMTASWGTMGYLWKRPVAVCFIRPQRYTFEFMEKSEHFTLSFFDETHRHILNICGKESGREVNKVEKAGLETVLDDNGFIYFKQAKLVVCCRKLYSDFIKPELILDTTIHKLYPENDYHKMFVGEIVNCLVSK